MTLRTARRAGRIAAHRAAHLDTLASSPDHAPEDCPEGLDLPGYRLDAILGAVAPILRRDGVQEHARRYARRTVQLTVPERGVLRSMVSAELDDLEGEAGRSRWQTQRLQSLRRILGKLDALDA